MRKDPDLPAPKVTKNPVMTVSFNGFESFDKALQTGCVEWKAGKCYTYKLIKSPLSDFTGFTFTFNDGTVTTSKKYSAKESDLTGNYIDVVSKKSLSGGTEAKEEWRIKSYQIDGESSVKVEGKSFEADGLRSCFEMFGLKSYSRFFDDFYWILKEQWRSIVTEKDRKKRKTDA